MVGVTTIVVDQDCDNCGWHCDNCGFLRQLWFFATIVVGVVTTVVDCDNCEHCDNSDHIIPPLLIFGYCHLTGLMS